MTNTTAIITAFLRPDSLRRCIDSVRRCYPELPIIVVDTSPVPTELTADPLLRYLHRPDIKANLSAARNAGVAACETPYLWLLEDDFELVDSDTLPALVDVLEHDQQISVVGAALAPQKGKAGSECKHINYSYHLTVMAGELHIRPAVVPWLTTSNGTLYRSCDLTWNFFTARTAVLRAVPWDEQLPVGEHYDWFLSLQEHGMRVAFSQKGVALHHACRSDEYVQYRGRAAEYRKLWLAKRGITKIVRIPPPDQTRPPNLVVLGTGRCGSSVLMHQLAALGWRVGRACIEFGENVEIRQLNSRALKTGHLDERAARQVLARLPRPWAIKDPRLAETLQWWLPLLVPYQPALLVLERDPAKVKASLQAAGWDETAGERRTPLINDLYDCWPWAKLRISYERLALAVSLFDVSRAGPLPKIDLGFRPAELLRKK